MQRFNCIDVLHDKLRSYEVELEQDEEKQVRTKQLPFKGESNIIEM